MKGDSYETPNWIKELFEEWKHKTFVNPPYSNPLPWIEKAIEENKKGKTIVLLLKLDCSTKWFLKLASAKAHIMMINERVKFNGKASPFPSMLAILEGDIKDRTQLLINEGKQKIL